MDIKMLKRCCALVMACYVILVSLYALVAGEHRKYKVYTTDAVTPTAVTGQILQGMEVVQPFVAEADEIFAVHMMISTFGRENNATLVVAIRDQNHSVIGKTEIETAAMKDGAETRVAFHEPVHVSSGAWYELVLSSPDAVDGNAVTAWYGNTMSATRTEIALNVKESERLRIQDEAVDGMLHVQFELRTELLLGQYYWHIVSAGGVLLAGFLLYQLHLATKGKATLVLGVINAIRKYRYLMKQLISLPR